MLDLPVINRTRNGFIYQDKYALLEILRFLGDGSLQEVYVELEYGTKNQSLDIKLVRSSGEETIYEIKTGDNFKDDKNSKIKNAILGLFDYFKQNKSHIILVIDNDLHASLAAVWADWLLIQEIKHPTMAQKNKKERNIKTKEYWEGYGFSEMGISLDDFKKFVCEIELKIGLNNEPTHFNLTSDLDNAIKFEIETFADRHDVKDSASIEVPYHSIEGELLGIIQLAASGKIKNLREAIGTRIADCLARRKVLAKQDHDGNMEEEIKKESKKIQEDILNISLPDSLDSTETESMVIEK